jgi:holo-[acyl-carrier protein] synthase
MHGLGVDVIEIERIERAVERYGERFLNRVFTGGEITYCRERRRTGSSLAVRFAAKEAFAKAVEVGVDPTWREVEVVMGAGGKPSLRLAPRLRAAIGACRVRVSLSHSDTVAVATVLID